MPFYKGMCLKENYSHMLNTELDLFLVYDVYSSSLNASHRSNSQTEYSL